MVGSQESEVAAYRGTLNLLQCQSSFVPSVLPSIQKGALHASSTTGFLEITLASLGISQMFPVATSNLAYADGVKSEGRVSRKIS